jgi:hypothetical protein
VRTLPFSIGSICWKWGRPNDTVSRAYGIVKEAIKMFVRP